MSPILAVLVLAQTVPAGFSEGLYVGSLASPTAMAFAPDGRLFVCEKGGTLRVVTPNGATGTLLATPFHTVSGNNADERGLLGVAFDPDFAVNQRVYVYYCHSGGTENRVSRLTASSAGSNVSDGTETVLHTLPQASGYHNGGGLHVGPVDGKLYLAVGEFHTSSTAQSLSSYGGKILRMNLDGSAPADNPASFPGIAGTTSGGYRRVWAVGLRNPFTFAFQPGTGRLFINDVGHTGSTSREEINDGIAGSNYGWPGSEGYTGNPDHRSPLFAYPRSGATPAGASIAGGAFYNPPVSNFPAGYVGLYFFTDYTQPWMYHYNPSTGAVTSFASGLSSPLDIQVGPDGALYYLSHTGQARRITYTGTSTQSIVLSADSLTVAEGSSGVVNVRLAVDPGTGTTIVVTPALGAGDASVGVSPPTLSFTGGAGGTWDDYQALTISAGEDADLLDEGATVTLSATGLPTRTVTVTTLDNDRPAGSPTARITLPRHGDTVSGTSADFFGDGTDTVGTTQAQFFIDGTLVSTDVNATGHYHLYGGHGGWNTTLWANGTHVLRMTVSDGSNTGSHEITVTVGNAAGGGGGGGSGGCGALGAEALLLLALRAFRRRGRRTSTERPS